MLDDTIQSREIVLIRLYLSVSGVLDKFKGLWQSTGSVIGLDIGSSSIKVVQLHNKKGSAVLETYGEIALGPYAGLAVGQATSLSIDKLAEATTDLLAEANVTTKVAALSIPLRSSLLKVIELPSYRESQINRMIPLEARKHIPVPISEVNLDWWILPKRQFSGNPDDVNSTDTNRDEKTEILLVAIHKNAVRKYQEIAKRVGLEVRTLEIETFSAIRAVFGRDISAMAILDIGASMTKLTIVDYGVVRVSHIINRGSQNITMALSKGTGISFDEAERLKRENGIAVETPAAAANTMASLTGSNNNPTSSMLEYIFYETNRVIHDYQRDHSRLVSRIVLTGGGSLLKGLQDVANNSFEMEVIMGHPFSKVQAPSLLDNILTDAGPPFAVSLGLAIHELGEG